MASGTLTRLAGPAYLANSATNIYTPSASTIYTVIRHIHFANVTVSAATFTLYIGATGASAGGTELFKLFSIAADSTYDYYPQYLRMASTDFLVGLASASSTITITVLAELSVV